MLTCTTRNDYAVSAVNSKYRRGSAPMSRSSVSRNRYAFSRLLYRNAISSRYAGR